MNKPALVVETLKEETDAGWPSPGRLISDLAKFSLEAIGNSLLNLITFPQTLLPGRKGLTPLKDNLILPEDKSPPPPPAQNQTNSSATIHTLSSSDINGDTSIKHQKSSKPPKYKDSSLVSKHRSSKRQDYSDFYSAEASQMGSKSQKDRTRHRHREKGGEIAFGVAGTEPKAADAKPPKDYGSEQKFDHYSMNNRYGTDSSYRFWKFF